MCTSASMCPPLAICLRDATTESYALVENTAFMQCLRARCITTESFRQLLANLYFIYDALEQEMRNHSNHPVISNLYFPRLERTLQLEKDLQFYYGDDWRSQIHLSGKTLCYVMRIHWVANDNPALLAAHAYVRYMGDLSDGQGLKASIRSALALPNGGGTAFYEFKGLPTVKAQQTFKAIYRDALNVLPLETDLATALIEEARLAFMLNRDVLKGLEPQLRITLGEAKWQLIWGETSLSTAGYHKRHHCSTELVSAIRDT